MSEKFSITALTMHAIIRLCVCVCVCVRDRHFRPAVCADHENFGPLSVGNSLTNPL